MGTGPYRIASFKTGNRLELTRFDGYWGKTAPAAKVSFVEVPELSARVAGLRSGEFDLITEVPPDQVKPLSADGRIDVTGGAIDNIYGLVFDCKSSAVMQSKELRQAILHAIDRDILVNALFAGRTSTADSFQSKTFGELYLATAGEKLYDPAKARALVKASGYRGEPIVWRIQAGYYTQELVVHAGVGLVPEEDHARRDHAVANEPCEHHDPALARIQLGHRHHGAFTDDTRYLLHGRENRNQD